MTAAACLRSFRSPLFAPPGRACGVGNGEGVLLAGWQDLHKTLARLQRTAATVFGSRGSLGRRDASQRQIFLPLPGSPSVLHIASTLSITAWSMRIWRPHSRLVSPGNLSVASRPILEPRPLTGEAKSR